MSCMVYEADAIYDALELTPKPIANMFLPEDDTPQYWEEYPLSLSRFAQQNMMLSKYVSSAKTFLP